ncbi:hypothetical protein ACHMW6_15450 [Pseudoduganella sp. UC29_106]|uniref:hypothetical protein n=1 Tax=Pseudoduganella sp. UC29_106 TaxID=3374553 RepID=UPI0037566078
MEAQNIDATAVGFWPIPDGTLVNVAYDAGGGAASTVSATFRVWDQQVGYLVLQVSGKPFYIPLSRIYHIAAR